MYQADKSELTGPSDAYLNVVEDYLPLLGRIFVGDMPRGIFTPGREILPVSGLIDLYDRSVDIIRKITAHGTDLIDRFDHLIRIRTSAVPDGFHSQHIQLIQRPAMLLHQIGRAVLHIENKQ